MNSSVTPEDWQDFSNANIEQAERERQSSVDLRSLVDGILQQSSNDMQKQCEAVDLAFSKRIAETKDTKGKLEDHLNKVLEAFLRASHIRTLAKQPRHGKTVIFRRDLNIFLH